MCLGELLNKVTNKYLQCTYIDITKPTLDSLVIGLAYLTRKIVIYFQIYWPGYTHTHSSFDLRYIFLPQKTPLHYAAKNGKLSVVKLLLEGEAQVDGRVDGMWSGFFPTKMVILLIKIYLGQVENVEVKVLKRKLQKQQQQQQQQQQQNHAL